MDDESEPIVITKLEAALLCDAMHVVEACVTLNLQRPLSSDDASIWVALHRRLEDVWQS